MTDRFQHHQPGLSSPGDPVAVTPADGTDLPGGKCRALMVGTGGVVVVVNDAGADVSVPCGDNQTLAIRTARVKATGTTAATIIAIY